MAVAAAFIVERRPNTIRERKDPLQFYTENEMLQEYRMDKETINELVDKLQLQLERKTARSNALSVEEIVLIALKTLASGSFQNSSKDSINVAHPTVSKVLNEFCEALLMHTKDYIFWPSNEELKINMQKFYEVAGFPRVVGAIDGTHIPIISPAENEHLYVNRKNFHSVNVQVGYC